MTETEITRMGVRRRGPVSDALAAALQSVDEPERRRIQEIREEIQAQLAEQDALLGRLEIRGQAWLAI